MRILGLVLAVFAGWAEATSLAVSGPSLKAPLRCEVFLPQAPGGGVPRNLPVVLLLHGGGGRAADFRALGAARLATAHGLILVAPEGATTAFLDAAADPTDRPGQALGGALLRALEQRFSISRARRDRAVVGVSLGGFAAIHAGFTHPERFGFVAALSGVVEWPQWGPEDLACLPTPMQALYRRAFGEPGDPARRRFDLFTRLNGLALRPRRRLPFIYLACGDEDIFRPGSLRLAQLLEKTGNPHFFSGGPGAHDPSYWQKELAESLRAFHRWRNPP